MNQNTGTQPTPAMVNRQVLAYLERGDVEKVAQAASDYTRTTVREDSFAFKIMEPQKATPEMLVPGLDEKLQIIETLEPDSPGAKWVPLQATPDGEYIYGSRYIVPIARVVTRKFEKDLAELLTYREDLRKIVSQNSIKDGLAAIDGKFVSTIKAICEDTAGTLPGVQNVTGKVQWIAASGGITKANLVEAFKMLPRGNANGKFVLRNWLMLMNDVTAQDLKKLDVNEIGDENVSEIWRSGLSTDVVMGLKSLYTIKSDLVPDNRIYFFAAPEFLGKAYYLHDWTMVMKKEAYFLEMWAYWMGGFAIGNIAGVAVADLDFS